MGQKSKIYNFSEEEVQQIIKDSLSFSDSGKNKTTSC